MNNLLETGRLYRLTLTPLAALLAHQPSYVIARYVVREPRHDPLHGDFLGWQAVFHIDGSDSSLSIPEEGFVAESVANLHQE